MTAAKVWQETVVLPTYPARRPEKSPLFLEKRAYQGSTGKVYPLPVTEGLEDTCRPVEYQALFLENEYLRVMILPELGGRIQRALDKTNNYDFVYYNHVIKPALVGLTGPWISGGIEFNWPQHHRPSTFAPVDFDYAANPDGSCTVRLSETDRMYGTKGMAEITLYPGRAYIEIRGRLYNPTDLPQTFLWWANPAVPVNDNTFSVFPPDVNAVVDHGRRAVSTFPIATGEYYKVDYSAGVDISRYRNIPVPTSYMADHSDFDFIGNYDDGVQAGLLHVADHHIAPGKKQWTWGCGDFGRAWDRNLTDADGPYIELMTGVYTDNQPDFSWLQPHEEKTFTQYFMPYKGVGRVSNATRDGVIGVARTDHGPVLRVYVTAPCPQGRITVCREGRTLLEHTGALSPLACFEAPLPAEALEPGCTVTVYDGTRELASYTTFVPENRPIPAPADPLPEPRALATTEELYLAGLHLEQYRHATFEPADYYREGLRRDPTDIRLNDAYGVLLYRRGRARESLPYLEAAVKKQTWRNPNPQSGGCRLHLGLALLAAGETEKAYDAFYKAAWNAETQNEAFFQLACLCAGRGAFAQALDFADRALPCRWHDMQTRTLKAALLRHLGQDNTALLEESLAIDPLYMGCLFEDGLRRGDLTRWRQKMRGEVDSYLTLARLYRHAGLYGDGLRVLESCPTETPLVWYYRGSLRLAAGDAAGAAADFARGEAACPDYCFPSHVEEISILEDAIRTLDTAPLARYCLGNLLYDKKQYERAAALWEEAVAQNPGLSMAWRNLAIARYNKQKDPAGALAAMERACTPCPPTARFLLEYDQLASRLDCPAARRLETLERHPDLVEERDDLYLRQVTLLNALGRWQEALDRLRRRHFHPWEGGEGLPSAQYRYSLVRLAVQALNAGENDRALTLLEQGLHYPENLGEGKLPNTPDNLFHFLMGVAQRRAGRSRQAEEAFRLAAAGDSEPAPVLYYNDQPSDYLFFKGLAQRMLGQEPEARRTWQSLCRYAQAHRDDRVHYDFFAVSLPEIEVFEEDIALRNRQYCDYLDALGRLGLGEKDAARALLEQVVARDPVHQGALLALDLPQDLTR